MIVVTAEVIQGKRIVEVKGLVKGNTIRARHMGHDFVAGLKNITGGEIREYTKLIAESRQQALDRMREDAALLGDNAVIGLRFQTSSLMQGAAELLAYGTAVVLEDE